MATFIEELLRDLRDDERHVGNAFLGNPKTADKTAWRAREIAWRDGAWRVPGNDEHNRYISVAAFRVNERGEWLRQERQFSSAAGLMIDDLGAEVGGSIKVPFAALRGLPPTYIIETSPGNHQAWYLFKERLRDKDLFEWLIKQFIKVRCGGIDPGMAGVTRVGRLPGSTNGKPENKGWQVRVTHSRPELRYNPKDLFSIWSLGPVYRPDPPAPPKRPPDDVSGRVANFVLVLEMLQLWGHNKKGRTGLFKGNVDESEFNIKGWLEIRCPWTHEHSDGADSGAAIQMPVAGNSMIGGFKCHHGHCVDSRTFKDLYRYVWDTLNDDVVAETAKDLDRNNRRWSNGKYAGFGIQQLTRRDPKKVAGGDRGF